ncbi:MAG: PQQ-binding-like beta-propeller repeat protein [Verrucomicrobiae bacterium]|nr:PQQ-binding-like beta-propeller repeat protein [Verrucomicrobiae bacterium]
MYQTIAIALTVATLAQSALSAQFDWPQWQGPDRTAQSKETGLLPVWPKDGPPLAWKINGLGGGDSAPSIAAGRIYGMSNRGEDEVVWALSEQDGKEVWAVRIAPAHSQNFPQSKEGPSATPTVDGDRLYVMGLAGNVVCLRTSDGKVVWQRNLVTDFGGAIPAWSYRESPLVDGDKLICTPGSDGAMLVALNKLTGETIWKTQMPGSSETAPASAPNAGGGAGGGGPAGGGAGSAAEVTGTKDPNLFVSEHWGMTAFSQKIPNGKYVAKLYFAETYQGITGPGQRVFSFDVQGTKFKDFDIWVKAGGPNKAYVETVPVQVTNGEFRIAFTSQVENPAIKAIEIVPQGESAGGASPAGTIRINAGASSPFTDSSGQVWQADSGFAGGMTNPGMGGAPGALGGGPGGADRGRGRPGGGFGGFPGLGSSGAAYASPIAIEFDGQRQYVQLTAKALIGVAAADGKFLWQYNRPANGMGINCSTPIYQDGIVFAASAYGAGGGAVKLSRESDGEVKATEVWSSRQMENHHGGVILHDGALFGSNGGNGGGYLICLDFRTGDILWNERDSDKRRVRKGSVAFADGRIYYRAEEGDLILIEPSRKEYLERGRFMQPERTRLPAWAHPVIANGKLYIRDQDMLFCYNVTAK